jgi:prepilin signal peptidase PulO-like enzyme (type II secretory pathway)
VQTGGATWSEVRAPFVAFFMVVIFEVFYMFDVIKGGADAKAAICLAILFPSYPEILSGIPLITPSMSTVLTFFPVALSTLFMGALISLAVPIYNLVKNTMNGEKFGKRALLSFDLPIDEVEKHQVWLVEWIDGGQIKSNFRRVRESETLKEDLAALRETGAEKVRVTYKIPFIIPLTIGLLEVLTIGNILFLVY